MELAKLTSFEHLQVGDKVTRITINGFQTFEFLGLDPRVKNEKYKYDYGYFLDSFGRVKVERWYKGYMEKNNIYVGYDTKFVKKVEYELLLLRMEYLKLEYLKEE